MSDASDAVAKAMAANRKLAASLLVRKEELEAEILKAGGQRSAALTEELAVVEGQLKGAIAEVAQLRKLAADLPANEARALVNAATDSDPLIRSPEQQALDNVRGHLAQLEAELHLSNELAAQPPAARPPTREEADADARRTLDELRAKRTRKL